MIIKMKKYLFIGAKEDLAEFFMAAQKEGFIEFIVSKNKRSKEIPESVKRIMDAIKILRNQPVKEPYLGNGGPEFADEVVTQILELKAEIEKLSEEKRFLQAEITRVAPFGDFSFDDIAFIESVTGKKIQFYCVKTTKTHETPETHDLIYIGTDYELDYFIGIHDHPTSYPGMIEVQFDRTVGELKNHFAFVDETLHQIEAELKGYAGHIDFLREALLGKLDIYNLKKTKEEVDYPIEGAIFSIEGWVPENKTEKLRPLIEGKAIFFEPIAVEEEDRVPTYMKNKGTSRIGEDLVRFYDIPAATDKDPSTWVLWAFVVFFSIIIADAGYGIIFLAIAFLIKWKFPQIKGAGKRFLKLFFILATGCIIWGALSTSIFGIQISPHNPVNRFSLIRALAAQKAEYIRRENGETYQHWQKEFPDLDEARDGREMLKVAVKQKEGKPSYEMLNEFSDSILLELSLLIGVIHISTSLLRYFFRNWANLGWVLFAIGGYLYFPVFLQATSIMEFTGIITRETAHTLGIELIYGGIGLAVVLAFIQKRWKGAGEITQVIQVFADILSYLRLYALALASGILASTFNDMGAKFGIVIGGLIILLGQTINLVLSVQGGVIHGLRLNLIEWYHFSFKGEGKLFNPLRRLKASNKKEE